MLVLQLRKLLQQQLQVFAEEGVVRQGVEALVWPHELAHEELEHPQGLPDEGPPPPAHRQGGGGEAAEGAVGGGAGVEEGAVHGLQVSG